ncbi:MAG: RNA polymerase factor sigma-54 [Burkholderiales bacterium]|nr:RNA polymerase factor sigma-54 [Burkholderiales bacterium]MCE7876513.1 RNA polymerase factor sigma-54 [Betaproteobacteria bacterium PRO3]
MKPTLQLKLSQHLTLTPQLQQSIRLLQLSTLELNAEVERMLQENPLLEKENEDEDAPPAEALVTAPGSAPSESGDSARAGDGDDERAEEPVDTAEAAEGSAPASETDFGDEGGSDGDWGSAGPGDDDDEFYPQQIASSTLRDHLMAQLGMLSLPQRDRQLVAALIDALDEDGFLSSSLEELAELFPEELEIDVGDLAIALRYLQGLEPTGVGARDIGEALALQLRALPEGTPFREAALKVVDGHLELLANRDVTRLRRLLHCDEATVRAIRDLIRTLKPKPGAAFANAEANYVVPDVLVRKVRGQWVASLNEAAMPKLRVNRIYADILSRSRDASNQQLAAQLQEAKWLIRNVQQRFETILRVAQAIVDRQRRFFEHGEVAMRPMVLREIADMLGLHESTISRVTTQKYLLTPRGTYELKYFFGSHVATDTGGAASATAIRALIRQLIGAEDPKAPLTDSKIAEVLGEQGILVARRTVAKYREALSIPPVNLRKSL